MMADRRGGRTFLLLMGILGLVAVAIEHGAGSRNGRHLPSGSITDRARETLPPDVKGNVAFNDEGSNATNPAQIPAGGWWSVIKRVSAGFIEDRLMTEAAAVTFYSLLAVFPAMATLVSLYGLVANPAAVNDQLSYLIGLVPSGGIDLIRDEVKSLTANGAATLGLGFAIGLLTSLWSANQGVKALFDALNVVYHEQEKRGYVLYTALSLLFTLGTILFAVVALTSVAVVPLLLKFLGLEHEAAGLIALTRWPTLMLVLTFLLALFYRYGPSREHPRWQWVSYGSAFATVAWIAASIGFSYYVANFSNYNKTYGSLGAAVGFTMWIWISTIVVLLGAEVNAELEQQTMRDSTTGPELPMGLRGAYKADHKS